MKNHHINAHTHTHTSKLFSCNKSCLRTFLPKTKQSTNQATILSLDTVGCLHVDRISVYSILYLSELFDSQLFCNASNLNPVCVRARAWSFLFWKISVRSLFEPLFCLCLNKWIASHWYDLWVCRPCLSCLNFFLRIQHDFHCPKVFVSTLTWPFSKSHRRRYRSRSSSSSSSLSI